jgi:hypothetical protein
VKIGGGRVKCATWQQQQFSSNKVRRVSRQKEVGKNNTRRQKPSRSNRQNKKKKRESVWSSGGELDVDISFFQTCRNSNDGQ